MRDRLQALADAARQEISGVSEPSQVEALRIRYLGKKGELSAVLGGMGKLPPDERRALGEIANTVKAELEQLLADATKRAEEAALEAQLKGPKLDVTLPGRAVLPGGRHPVSRTLEDIVRTFARLGFEVAVGPEIELDYFNFEALNLPKDHPARDMQDTFYVDEPSLGHAKKADSPSLLRTHTSPVQVRHMLSRKPPIRAVMPGRVYRRDSDITHTPMFHQVEGLLVDKDVSFAELKGTLDAFVKAFFGSETRTRFRPSFFPFTEPSAEVDVTCASCGGKGCRVCKQTGWLEVLGSGMVHPNVFTAAGYDPKEVTGYAFGMGVERLAMLRYGIDDLRMMFENDARFLAQF
ncbi:MULTISPECIES: phenylalanine--tRNA ligase subunit alpha [Corallococcus]|uniref:Phenylalanine--tRNA ligase alpha subunit n=1 Tax=Corallococcus coralloides (strain ATCC 25202 / DSM 2259 / NBRC 100086 / M2) TaxID=1144275 RepID=H8MFB8_CORCM|nr:MULTISPECIES: phenylalanine--tRNA ligase subunit alpha [Corallococcus]AFE09805.1 phenylalanyl-tRNA synthetase subunit alpha [Corallococcus coralloides DSM 2259]MBN9685571.1 phenylalanine--tRNA ligase subunit alpha [Corallococcus sp. NCSPR001]RKG71626.1 phenylalanine--tRNA ligase subunit alpha [Corallococcus sp. CA054B]WAS82981.1 phenylalanine--tRNA ligase subunit alpha [Corallococcus sp. NCRR]